MSGALVVAEHLQGRLREPTLEAITAAAALGGPVTVLAIDADPSALVGPLSVEGVDEVACATVDAPTFEPDAYLAAVSAAVSERQPDVVLAGFTVNSMGYLPALAAREGGGFASDVFGVRRHDGALVATRAYYGSKVHAEVAFPAGGPTVLLLRPTAWPSAGGSSSPGVSTIDVPPVPRRVRHVSFEEAPQGDVDITTADFLLSIGRGVGEKDNVETFVELADTMGATLSVSRPLVDAGWMPSNRQVGQSGKTVKPKVYLAMGISGAVQHLAGMKTSGTIIAVNSDPEAAIFRVAHYGAVMDLFEVAEELERQWAR
jgi:electron transfer flavoprotein alpha subunit